MPIINLEHFERLHVGNHSSIIGITQSDAFGNINNKIYLMDSEMLSTDEKIHLQRPLFHTEFLVDDNDSGNIPADHRETPVGILPHKRMFYNLYDVKDAASKTQLEGRIGDVPLWQLDANLNHDNYAPVLSADPFGFAAHEQVLYMLSKPTNEAPLIKTTDLLFTRESLMSADGHVTTTEWCYQLSSSSPDTHIATYGYVPLSDLSYPSRYIPISTLYLRIGNKELCASITKANANMTVGSVSSKINAAGAADWQLDQLTALFGKNWQNGLANRFGDVGLSNFYYHSRHDNGASYEDYIRDMGGDPGISVLQINKFDFSRMDYNYIYWNLLKKPNQFSGGDMWFDLLYGKNSYTSRYSQQYAPDDNPKRLSPGNFNRARSYSSIGVGGGYAFLTYYDDMYYKSSGDKKDVVAKLSDFSTAKNKNGVYEIKDGDQPRSNPLEHDNDYSNTDDKQNRSYPHIEQILQLNVLGNQSMHPSNLYKIELKEQYLKWLLAGIRKEENGLTLVNEVKTDIKNSIRGIAKKFAPATTELLTVQFS